MPTDFFNRKTGKIAALLLSTIFTLCALLYALFLSGVTVVEWRVGFFYLVSDEKNVEVGAEFIRLDGGAGYLMRRNGKEYAVLSVYFDEADGVAVQANMQNGKKTELLYVGVDGLHFKTYAEKKNAAVYTGALQTFYHCAEVFDGVIARLDDGATQESVKGGISSLASVLSRLAITHESVYGPFAKVCRRFAESLRTSCEKIVMAADLRYILCDMTESCLALAGAFSL